MYHTKVEEIKEDLKRATRHAFATDGWQSVATESYITFTVCFVDPGTYEMKTYVLDTHKYSLSHTSENLCELIKDTVAKWGLKDPVGVTDNAGNIVKGCRMTGQPHIGCFAHILNLAVNCCCAVKEVATLTGKCKTSVNVFRRSAKKTSKLKDAEALLGIKVIYIFF
jgi:hypothetical protein